MIQKKKLWYRLYQFRKYRQFNKWIRGTSSTIKSEYNKIWRELNKYRVDKQKKSLNFSEAINIIKKLGLKLDKPRKTAIRGYTIPNSNSYELNKDDPSFIGFNGISEKTYNKIVNELKRAGFNIKNLNKPSKVPGGPNYSSLNLR